MRIGSSRKRARRAFLFPPSFRGSRFPPISRFPCEGVRRFTSRSTLRRSSPIFMRMNFMSSFMCSRALVCRRCGTEEAYRFKRGSAASSAPGRRIGSGVSARSMLFSKPSFQAIFFCVPLRTSRCPKAGSSCSGGRLSLQSTFFCGFCGRVLFAGFAMRLRSVRFYPFSFASLHGERGRKVRALSRFTASILRTN